MQSIRCSSKRCCSSACSFCVRTAAASPTTFAIELAPDGSGVGRPPQKKGPQGREVGGLSCAKHTTQDGEASYAAGLRAKETSSALSTPLSISSFRHKTRIASKCRPSDIHMIRFRLRRAGQSRPSDLAGRPARIISDPARVDRLQLSSTPNPRTFALLRQGRSARISWGRHRSGMSSLTCGAGRWTTMDPNGSTIRLALMASPRAMIAQSSRPSPHRGARMRDYVAKPLPTCEAFT
jgi:hypothetical protein